MTMTYNALLPTIDLAGRWQFRLGMTAPWGEITVPGCWEAQGYGNDSDGPAYYRREVLIPAEWQGESIWLECDAVSYAATIRCNGRQVGKHIGLWTPFQIDLTGAAQPGALNTIEVEVWKPANHPPDPALAVTAEINPAPARYPLRTTLAGFLPDVATTFGGLWQGVRLRCGASGFQGVQASPDPTTGAVRVSGDFFYTAPPTPAAGLTIQLSIAQGEREVARLFRPLTSKHFDLTLHVPHFQRWSPATPHCYRLFLVVRQGSRLLATHELPVAFRRLTAVGEQLLLNDTPIALRGVLSWGWDAAVIAPYYTAEAVRAEIRRVKAQGFNLIKLCLFIPNQSYYEIANEEGILLWQEWPLWLPDLTPTVRQQVVAEYAEYMRLTQHHPAVVLYSLGCELDQAADAELLGQLNQLVRSAVRDVLICDNSGSGEAYGGLAVDFADFTDYHTYGELHFLEATLDNWRRDWQPVRPWIFGEFCDADGFRDRDELMVANGGVPPWWMSTANPTHRWRPEVRALVEAPARLQAAALPFTDAELVRIAAEQALMVRKYTLETVRKRNAVQGYVITGLRDTPIATSGIFDDFDRPKWEPARFRLFNDDALLMVEVSRSRHWHHGGDRAARLDLHNWWADEVGQFSVMLNQATAATVTSGRVQWQLLDPQGEPVATGELRTTQPVPPGRPIGIGVITLRLPARATPQQYCLQLHFTSQEVQCRNTWPLWAYPQPAAGQPECVRYDPAALLADFAAWGPVVDELTDQVEPVIVTSMLDRAVVEQLSAGGRVLLLAQTSALAHHLPFWREAVKLIMPHPLWNHFPHQGFVDHQFFGLATDLAFDPARLLAQLPPGAVYTPVLRRLDARAFTIADYLVEITVGKGRLFACTLRLQGGAGVQPTGLAHHVAGRHLLTTLLDQLADCSAVAPAVQAAPQSD